MQAPSDIRPQQHLPASENGSLPGVCVSLLYNLVSDQFCFRYEYLGTDKYFLRAPCTPLAQYC